MMSSQATKLLVDMCHRLTIDRCCGVAYEFAIKNALVVPESLEKNIKNGRDWWSGFISILHLDEQLLINSMIILQLLWINTN